MNTEKRFYLIHSDDFDNSEFNDRSPNEITDDEFATVCENHGFVFTPEGLAQEINDGDFYTNDHYCRLLEIIPGV